MIFAVGWILVIFIHLNTLKRNSISSIRDTLIEEIYELINLYDEDKKSFEEQAFEHKIIRIERKINEMNSIYHSAIISVKSNQISNLITFDIESTDAKKKLTQLCFDAVEFIDKKYHESTNRHSSILYLNRYEIGGVTAASISLYCLFKVLNFFFNGNI